jgi:hypothetical protein
MNDLKQYESQISEIFTLDKLPVILAVINSLRPPYGEWLKETEFDTVVHVAQIQAIDKLQKDLAQFVINGSTLPKAN